MKPLRLYRKRKIKPLRFFMQRNHSTGRSSEICFSSVTACVCMAEDWILGCLIMQLSSFCSIFPKGSTDPFSLCWTASSYEIWRTAISFSPSPHSQVRFKSAFLHQVISQRRSTGTDQQSGSIYFISSRSLAKTGLVQLI